MAHHVSILVHAAFLAVGAIGVYFAFGLIAQPLMFRVVSVWAAFVELGPGPAASACAFDLPYRYDARRDVPDSRLLRERPDEAVATYLRAKGTTDFTIGTIEVNPIEGVAEVWVRRPGTSQSEQIFRLSGRGAPMSVDLPAHEIFYCNDYLFDWTVQGERPAEVAR